MDTDLSVLLLSNVPAIVPSASDYFLIAFLLLIILINAIISGSEVAYFTMEPEEADEVMNSTDPKDERLATLLRKPEKLLASIVITYTFLNILILVLSYHLLGKIPYFGHAQHETLKVIISIALLLVFVEMIPKLYALADTRKFARRYAPFIRLFSTFTYPFSSFMPNSSDTILKSASQRKHEISMDDLSKALEITSNEITHEQEKDMLEGIIRFKDTIVDDIMVARADVVALDLTTPFKSVIDFIVEAGFSRIPVYEEDSDDIKGVLYVKDLLPYLNRHDNFRWQSLVRPAYFVPGTKRIDDLLEEFRTNKNHMAIVVDEYGGTTGIVTMEDILEEIVGDISDEYDEEKSFYSIAPDGSYIFDGKTPLEDFFSITGIPQQEFEQYTNESDTVAGLVLELKGNFPKRKEIITYKKYQLQAEEMTKRRIVKVRYIPSATKEKNKITE